MILMPRCLTLFLFAAALVGCSFDRVVVNGYVRDLDTSWIQPGVTTRAEVIDRLGRPPAMVGAKGVRPDSSGAIGVFLGAFRGGGLAAVGMDAEGEADGSSSRSLRWFAMDSYVKAWDGGWIVYPTFSHHRQHRGHDIFVRFDEQGVVTLLSRVEMTDDAVKVIEWKEARR